jgi:DNA mismatch repair ATPase MutL
VVNSVTGLQGSFPPLPAIDRILDIDPLHPALRQLDQEHQQQQQQKQQQLQQQLQQQQQQQKQQHQHHQQEDQKQQQRRRQVQQQQRQNEATNVRAHSPRSQPRLPSNVKAWAGLKSEEDVRFRIQRSIERNAIGNGHQTGQPSDLTTVLCLHASGKFEVAPPSFFLFFFVWCSSAPLILLLMNSAQSPKNLMGKRNDFCALRQWRELMEL